MTQATFAGNAPANQGNLSEARFQAQIVDMAAAHGWTMRYHNLYAVGSDSGYPDLTLVHPIRGVVWLEVKGPKPTIYARQVEWLETLQASGERAYLVYPTDFDRVADLLAVGTLTAEDHAALVENQYLYQAKEKHRRGRR